MTLATHAAVGGAVAALFPSHPITAFIAGFMSHFVLDAIPHWDYKILSAYANSDIAMSANADQAGVSEKFQADKNFKLDLLRTGTDGLLGVILVLLIWQPSTISQLYILALGALGGVLPDFLQFVYMRFPHQPMVALQKFHSFIHAKYRLNDTPVIGILFQVLTIVAVTALVNYLRFL